MIDFEISTLVDRPIEDVFIFSSNPLNTPKWQVKVAKVEQLTPDPIGVGSKFNSRAGMLGQAMDGLMEIIEYDPPTKFGLSNHAGPMKMRIIVTLKPVGTGTQITINVQGYPEWLFKQLMGQVKIQMEANVAKLKALLEAKI